MCLFSVYTSNMNNKQIIQLCQEWGRLKIVLFQQVWTESKDYFDQHSPRIDNIYIIHLHALFEQLNDKYQQLYSDNFILCDRIP